MDRVPAIVSSSDPALREVCVPFDFSEDRALDDARVLADILRYTIITMKSIGISAPQVGFNSRVIAAGNPDDINSIIVAFNPVIIDAYGDDVKYEEGCLSFRGLYLNIKRKANIRVRYTMQDGTTDTIKMSGLTSRVFQHEIDHLNGVLFVDRVNSFELQRGRKKQKQLLRKMKSMAKDKVNFTPPKVALFDTSVTSGTTSELRNDSNLSTCVNSNFLDSPWSPALDRSIIV